MKQYGRFLEETSMNYINLSSIDSFSNLKEEHMRKKHHFDYGTEKKIFHLF
jgi:hypothetical protein